METETAPPSQRTAPFIRSLWEDAETGRWTGAAADPGAGGTAPMPGVPASTRSAAQAAGENRLPRPDRLIATEQAIQLDELIKWLRRQATVDNNGSAGASPRRD
jgi:hypothetical protein